MALTGKTVLVVDDAPDTRLILRKILENSGLIVTEVGTISDALDAVKSWTPHLILLDLSLGDESGFEILSARKHDPALQNVPVIVVSGSNDRETVSRAIVAGAAEYLIKPFVASRLNQKIRKVLRDQDFLRRRFTPDSMPKLSVEVEAKVTQLFESSLHLEAQVKTVGDREVGLTSPEFSKLGIESSVFMTGSSGSKSLSSGFYLTTVKVLGLREPITRKMKSSGKGNE